MHWLMLDCAYLNKEISESASKSRRDFVVVISSYTVRVFEIFVLRVEVGRGAEKWV